MRVGPLSVRAAKRGLLPTIGPQGAGDFDGNQTERESVVPFREFAPEVDSIQTR
jgi:hypothetical protein